MNLIILEPEDCDTPPAGASPAADAQVGGMLQEFDDVFPADLPLALPPARHVQHQIDLVPAAKPPLRSPYRMSADELQDRAQLAQLLDKGLIEPSCAPYAAPVLFVKRKDGARRLCVDYRALDRPTIRSAYLLSRVDGRLDRRAPAVL